MVCLRMPWAHFVSEQVQTKILPTRAHVRAHTYTRTHAHTHTFTHAHTHTRTHAHTHTHTDVLHLPNRPGPAIRVGRYLDMGGGNFIANEEDPENAYNDNNVLFQVTQLLLLVLLSLSPCCHTYSHSEPHPTSR